MKVLVPEKIDAAALNTLRDQGHQVDEVNGLSASALREIIGTYDALIVRSATLVDADLLASAHNLKVVGRAGTGVDNIDIPACTEKGVLVVNTPDANTNAAAELAVGLAYAVFRNIGEANLKARRGDFRRNTMAGNELEGKVAGLIGFGRIAQNVAKKLMGVGMTVMAYDPFMPKERVERFNVTHCDTLEALLPHVDLISIHTPKTKETVNLLDKPQFDLCKKGVRIVNAARGGLVNETALYDALQSGQVAACAMDVLAKEPNFTLTAEAQTFDHPLLHLDNFTYTPHLGASTAEASARVGFGVTELIGRVLAGEMVPAINMPPIEGSVEDILPLIQLCERLGSIYYQAEKTPLSRVKVIFGGDLAAQDHALLTLSVLKGILTPISENRINFVNVKQNIDEMGIDVAVESDPSAGHYDRLITLRFYQESGKVFQVSGTIVGQDIQLITELFGYAVDFPLKPNLIAMQNDDIPGVIGQVGTILGEAKLNISMLNWATKEGHGKAQAIIAVDAEVPQSLLERLTKIEPVRRVTVLHF